MSFENETNMNNIEELTDINEETSSETAVSEEVSSFISVSSSILFIFVSFSKLIILPPLFYTIIN